MSFKAVAISLCAIWLFCGCISHYSLVGGSNGGMLQKLFAGHIQDAPIRDTKPAPKEGQSYLWMSIVDCLLWITVLVALWLKHFFTALQMLLAAVLLPILTFEIGHYAGWIIGLSIAGIAIYCIVHYYFVIKPLDKRK